MQMFYKNKFFKTSRKMWLTQAIIKGATEAMSHSENN